MPHSRSQEVLPSPSSPLNVHHPQSESRAYEFNHSDGDVDGASDDNGEPHEEGPKNDLLEIFEIVGKEGIVERTTTGMKVKDVFRMPAGLRIKVHVNIHGQPIRAARQVLTRYMTKLVMQPHLCPPDLNDFHEVKSIHGVDLLRAVRENFYLPPRDDVDKVLIALFDTKYRYVKYMTRKKLISNAKARLVKKIQTDLEESGYNGMEIERAINGHEFTDAEIEKELDEMEPPPGFSRHQWLKFKMDMKSAKAKELSKKGKKARAAQTHTHTTGTKSYAQVEDEHVIKHKTEPGLVKFFELTHKRKDGTYIQDESRQFMVAATSELEENKVEGSHGNEKELENFVWYKLMGEDSPGRARGYGAGVTKSQVTGFHSHLKRMRLERVPCNDSILLHKLQAKILDQQKMMKIYMAKTDETISSLRDEVQIYRTAFGISNSQDICDGSPDGSAPC